MEEALGARERAARAGPGSPADGPHNSPPATAVLGSEGALPLLDGIETMDARIRVLKEERTPNFPGRAGDFEFDEGSLKKPKVPDRPYTFTKTGELISRLGDVNNPLPHRLDDPGFLVNEAGTASSGFKIRLQQTQLAGSAAGSQRAEPVGSRRAVNLGAAARPKPPAPRLVASAQPGASFKSQKMSSRVSQVGGQTEETDKVADAPIITKNEENKLALFSQTGHGSEGPARSQSLGKDRASSLRMGEPEEKAKLAQLMASREGELEERKSGHAVRITNGNQQA